MRLEHAPRELPHIARLALVCLCGTAGAQESLYSEVSGWLRPPFDRALGSVSSVYPGSDGHLWIAERCGQNSCVGRDSLAPVQLYDPSGRWVRGFGEALFLWPHGIYVDSDGNIWVTDADGDGPRGHQVFKFSPQGGILMRRVRYSARKSALRPCESTYADRVVSDGPGPLAYC